VGEGLVSHIVAERTARGPFSDFYDFCARVDPMVLNKRTVESLIKAGGFDSLGHPRKGLCLVFEQVIDRTLARRREADAGIQSLFGCGDPFGGSGTGGDAAVGDAAGVDGGVVGVVGVFDDGRVPIPEVEFDKTQRLAFEKEMLGLYISDHPLLGAEAALRRRAECSVAELRELPDGEVRAVGGVVTGLVRKYTKRGDLMATFILEDLQSSIDAWVFPRTMTEHGYKLVDDAIVVVKGRLDTREDTPKLVVMEVDVPVLTAAPAVRLRLSTAALSDQVVEQLKKTLVAHPGDAPVFLLVGSKVLRLPAEFSVDVGNGLYPDLRLVPGIEICS
jgi:DNA polymerase-3 subunit alpha